MRFGLFDFEPETGTLSREGVPVRLQPQPARVLALLVERAGEVVSRDDLRQRIWGNETFVDFERGLNFCVAQIRSALGDSATSPRFIETVPRQGYRFIAPVGPAAAGPGARSTSGEPSRRLGPPIRWGSAMIAVAALVLIGIGLTAGPPWVVGSRPQIVRIAVVPFDNETGDAAYDQVAQGVADATVARLAGPEFLPHFLVIGNAAILRRPRDRRDLKAIGAELGVQYVVLGQVKRDRERVRLIAHLIRVSDQTHLWGSTFDRSSFTLAVQAELADVIASSVSARLIAGLSQAGKSFAEFELRPHLELL